MGKQLYLEPLKSAPGHSMFHYSVQECPKTGHFTHYSNGDIRGV